MVAKNMDFYSGAVAVEWLQRKIILAKAFTMGWVEAGIDGLPLDKYLQIQTIRYAMKEINSNPNLLPNISLGFQIYDSCRVLQKELEVTLWMITGQNKAIPNFHCQKRKQLTAIIGYSTSTFSILMAHILSVIRYPQKWSRFSKTATSIGTESSVVDQTGSEPADCEDQKENPKESSGTGQIQETRTGGKISHISTSSILSDRTQFPFFLRTAPSDAFQSKGLAQLVLHFGWTWVGMVADSNDYGYQGIQGVKQEILKSGACVEFMEYIQSNRPDRNIPRIIQTIKMSRAKAVIVFSSDVDLIVLFDKILSQNITQKIWVASEGWATSNLLSAEKYLNLLAGTMGFAYYSEYIPGFREFIDNFHFSKLSTELWDWMFWEASLGCAFLDFRNITFVHERPTRNCTKEDRVENFQIYLNNVTSTRLLYNLYSAVYVVAKALHDLSMCRDGKGPFSNGSCSDIWNLKPWQVFHYMKKVRVKLSSGRDLFFDKHGDPPPVYDIVNWQMDFAGKMRQVKVGNYNSTAPHAKTLMLNTSSIQWRFGDQKEFFSQIPISVCSQSCLPGFRKASMRGEPSCCYECVPCSQGEISNETDSTDCFKCPWNEWPSEEKHRCLPKPVEYLSYEETLGITLASTSVASSFVPMAILGVLMCYKYTPIVRANNYTISCLLLISLSLCFLCSLAFIGYPQREKCILRHVTFGMVFSLCVSCILAKTIVVMTAFKATKPGSDLRRWASPHMSYLVIILGMLLQFLICLMWLIISPPFPEYNLHTKTGTLILQCNKGSPTAFWLTLGYLSFLAVMSCLVAFLARQLPDSFNEAKFITFSMQAFFSVWLSFIPASLSTSGKYTEAMEIFAILSSSWALLCCMFAPKCYIILFRPSVNSRKLLLVKN
ncbi:extracellular calcium-sensing receptor-like [Mixophyes fleayi]|uniref:extracellular calcium-sensing receptor-like n=1 Tax=Mixophyes fleayi TaxID=3061075 RepID=UPI003F4DFCAC